MHVSLWTMQNNKRKNFRSSFQPKNEDYVEGLRQVVSAVVEFMGSGRPAFGKEHKSCCTMSVFAEHPIGMICVF